MGKGDTGKWDYWEQPPTQDDPTILILSRKMETLENGNTGKEDTGKWGDWEPLPVREERRGKDFLWNSQNCRRKCQGQQEQFGGAQRKQHREEGCSSPWAGHTN